MKMPRLNAKFFSVLLLCFFILYLLSYIAFNKTLTSSPLTRRPTGEKGKDQLTHNMLDRIEANQKLHGALQDRPELQQEEEGGNPIDEQTDTREIISQSSDSAVVALAPTADHEQKSGLKTLTTTAGKHTRYTKLQVNGKNDKVSMTINDVPAADAKVPMIINNVPKAGKTVPAPEDGFFDPSTVDPALELKFVAEPIPKAVVNYVKQLKNPHDLPNCKTQRPKQNFVYIKTHKTASDSLAAMFRRFAYDRNLSVVLPVGNKFSIGWPHDLIKKFHRPSKTGGFNVLVDHAKYTEDYMQEIMPKDTVYITSWRETFSHLKSAMAYFNIRQWGGITQDPPDGMEVFLQNMKHYDDIYKILFPQNLFRAKRSCIPGDISMARNSIAADIGFPVGFPPGVYPDHSDNFTAIKEWLEHSNKVFSVVLLSDHFHHSLVMMKRMMCWSTKDILYERMNTWNTKYRPEYRQELVDNFRRWSAADYLAFELFNQTLWDRIEKWGHEDFMSELVQYETTLEQTRSFCRTIKKAENVTERLDVAPTAWDSGFTVNKADCDFLKHHMRDTIKEKYDKIPVTVEQPSARDVPGC